MVRTVLCSCAVAFLAVSVALHSSQRRRRTGQARRLGPQASSGGRVPRVVELRSRLADMRQLDRLPGGGKGEFN